jgi:hypothetical protein
MIIGLCGVAGSGKDTVADFLVKNHAFVKVALADPLKRICKDVFAFTDEQLWGPSAERNKPDERYPREEESAVAHEERCIKCEALHVNPKPGTLIKRVGESLYKKPCPKGGEHEIRQAARFGQHYLTPRFALQQLGTEWGRNCYPNVWVDYALRVALVLKDGGFYYDAKSGVRFLSQLESRSDWVKGKKDVVISDVRFLNEVEAIRSAGGYVWKIERPGAGLEGAAAEHASEKLDIPEDLFSFIVGNDSTLEALEKGTALMLEETLRLEAER